MELTFPREKFNELWKENSGGTLTLTLKVELPPYPEDVEPTEPEEPTGNTYSLTRGDEQTGADFRFEKSSSYQDKYFVIFNASFKDRIASVTVGDETFGFKENYKGARPLFYGTSGSGQVVVTMLNGDVYKSTEDNQTSPTNIIDTDAFWQCNEGTTGDFLGKFCIKFCRGESLYKKDGVTINGKRMKEHGPGDTGRQLFYLQNGLPKSGVILAELKDGTGYHRFNVKLGDKGSCYNK